MSTQNLQPERPFRLTLKYAVTMATSPSISSLAMLGLLTGYLQLSLSLQKVGVSLNKFVCLSDIHGQPACSTQQYTSRAI